MTSTTSTHDVEEEDDPEESHINWNNLIFLPFHSTFKLIVMLSVISKSILGPIQSVYPIVYCWESMDYNYFLSAVKFFYWYCADPIYGIDTFLYIVHRQVTDEALKREHLPKSGLCLVLDFAAIIPFFRLLVVNDCPPTQFWPNILSFNEVLILYRVLEYYDLTITHSVVNMVFGSMLLMLCVLNAMTCFWLLLTYDGLCDACNRLITFDWRNPIEHKFNETEVSYSTYVYGMVFVLTFITNSHIDDMRPITIREYLAVNVIIMFGYILAICVIIPKVFAETILSYRRISSAYPHVRRLVEETKRRNTSEKAYKSVENFYSVMWRKRSGITHIPNVIMELPRNLRVDIKQDLSWALFQHSPTLRKTSISFKRYVVEYIIHDFKLPGERFFAGPQSHSSLYYVKSGVVQILSEDEGMTPILSVTSGTIFGDVSFQITPWKRKVIIKCLSYCEVMCLTRFDYIKALHKFPEDRNDILCSTRERIQHAKTLYSCKQNVRGLDRAKDEGIFWVKRRWWELADFISNWKKKSRKENRHCDLPPEESEYHCAKYLGQLVLCTEAQLLTKSMFANVNFPWLFVPQSSFIYGWRKVVLVTVIMVLLVYPPFITAKVTPPWFKFFQILVDSIYAFDICISLLTAMMKRGNAPTNFASVMFARCKTLYFNLDFISTIWIEYVVVVIGNKKHFYIAQANRLIKIYILFTGEFTQSDITKNPLSSVFMRIILCHFCFVYISGYFIYTLHVNFLPNLTVNYFFGEKYCDYTKPGFCDPGARGPLGVIVSWIIETIVFSKLSPRNLTDIYVASAYSCMAFMISLYCKTMFISAIYLKTREVMNFQNFVTNSKKYYEYYKIHHDLLKRLDKYLMCHWKYYQGADIMHPNLLKDEPYDIYRKVQGEVAEKIIGQSQAFYGADPGLVKDLAYAARFLILPRTSTLFLFGVQCRMVTWVTQGQVKCEYHSEDGELLKVFYPPGSMLSVSSVFLGKASLRTYSACTDCEILYIKIHDFYNIIKQYPNEWSHLDRCISEFAPIFEDMFQSYVKKHTDYLKRLKDRVFHARRSTVAVKKNKNVTVNIDNKPKLPIEHDFWTEPESDFMQYWMFFRAIIVVVSILNAAVQGGSGAEYRRILTMVGAFCDCIAWMDIVLKMFMAYYNDKGILVYDKRKCMFHYLTRGFVLDVIGCAPWHDVVSKLVSMHLSYDYFMLINTFCKFAHLYILNGYLDYLSDRPTINAAYMTILKLQLVMVLTLFGACHYLMSYCVDLDFDDHANLTSYSFLDTCWMPKFFELQGRHDDEHHLHLLYAESINLAQCGLVGVNSGDFVVNRQNLGVGFPLILMLLLFWYVMGYSLTLLLLNSRGNTLYQHGVSQLRKFLTEERVDQKLINRAVAHFTYWWHRTKGINIEHLTNERIGVVFRQDLSYYFFKKTLIALDSLLQGGENVCRQLASVSHQVFILPGDEVIREMDLLASVYVVHRGKILISQNGEVLATLAKGSIFGQLEGTKARPARVSAQSEEHADLLLINVKQFQDLINDDVRKVIAKNPTSKVDYMATKEYFVENPYDSITYILRGRKTIYLPWMVKPQEVHHGNWYSHWLYFVWLIEPFTTAFLVITLPTLAAERANKIYFVLITLDIVFLINFVFEFFTMELVVVEQKCVRRKVGPRMFKKFCYYIDSVTLLVPLLTIVTGDVGYQLIRLLRLRLLYNFNAQFCKTFKTKIAPILVKFAMIVLFFHASSCGWIVIACKGKFPIPTPTGIPAWYNKTVNTDEWVFPEDRPGGDGGCARLLSVIHPSMNKTMFVVPKNWYDDYILAMTHVFLIYTHTTIKAFVPLTIAQIYYLICITFAIFLIDIWIMSVAISFVYTRFRELYQYDYNVNNLITYLKHSGLSPVLLHSVKKYTSQLWTRQRGNWLPELAQQAPICLREDLLCALYEHHLETPPLLRQLPHYFKRQVAARLKRIVIFPGKCIVAEGDIFPCMYFIHEGEVEKWYMDKTSGENRLMSLLCTNGYFGQIAGLFPNFAFQFSYYSRTVVDMVYLRLRDWQDLLDGYPDIKHDLYSSVKEFKGAFTNYGKT